MKNSKISFNNITNVQFFSLLFILFIPSLMFGQTETYKPGVKNRPTEKIWVMFPNNNLQEVTVERIGNKYVLGGDMIVYPYAIAAGGVDRESRWPSGVIPYQIKRNHPFRSTIMNAIEEINALTNLQLIPKTNQSRYVKIEYNAKDGCYSDVGKNTFFVNTLSLGEHCNHKGIVIHELLHTAGLFHEQSRTDRDKHIRILKNNIHKGKIHNFEKYKCNYKGVDIGPYDFNSIMHYPTYTTDKKFAKNINKPILETIPAGRRIRQKNGMSAGDISGINAMYPKRSSAGRQYNWTALNTISGVIKSGEYFGLQNATYSNMVVYKKREYGINLSWSKNLNLRNIKFVKRPVGGRVPRTRDLRSGDRVAIYVKGKGYLKYKKRKYGINIVWSDKPVFEWTLRASSGSKLISGKPFSIYNHVEKDYLIYFKRKYGINFKWLKGCKFKISKYAAQEKARKQLLELLKRRR